AALTRLQNEDWMADMPKENVRVAAARPKHLLNRLYTPDAADLALNNPKRNEAVQKFQRQWALGIPVVVRNIHRGFDWRPECMMRATRDVRAVKAKGAGAAHRKGRGQKKVPATADEPEEKTGRICDNVQVIDCADWTSSTMSQEAFFKHYQTWDPETPLQRHHQDFLEMLPIPEVTHPQGPLNLHGYFPELTIKPDLGPKSYIALGNSQEVCGKDSDSVTKIHVDLSDAINVTLHVQRGADEPPPHVRCGDEVADAKADPTYGGAGAVWQIFARTDVPLLQEWMQDHANEFLHAGEHPSGFDLLEPICHQKFMLDSEHLESLWRNKGVQTWTVEQHDGEGIFIPAGCPHQVRNLRPATKVALDFVAPESAEVAQRLREVRRRLCMLEVRNNEGVAVEELEYHDKLQAMCMLQRAVCWALAELTGNKAHLPPVLEPTPKKGKATAPRSPSKPAAKRRSGPAGLKRGRKDISEPEGAASCDNSRPAAKRTRCSAPRGAKAGLKRSLREMSLPKSTSCDDSMDDVPLRQEGIGGDLYPPQQDGCRCKGPAAGIQAQQAPISSVQASDSQPILSPQERKRAQQMFEYPEDATCSEGLAQHPASSIAYGGDRPAGTALAGEGLAEDTPRQPTSSIAYAGDQPARMADTGGAQTATSAPPEQEPSHAVPAGGDMPTWMRPNTRRNAQMHEAVKAGKVLRASGQAATSSLGSEQSHQSSLGQQQAQAGIHHGASAEPLSQQNHCQEAPQTVPGGGQSYQSTDAIRRRFHEALAQTGPAMNGKAYPPDTY
ncbi:hypothetical protein WJX84_001117, partial [Apatococcus fuscideae]